MKWECLAIVLVTPLKEEWVSTFRIWLLFSEPSHVKSVKLGFNFSFLLFA